MKIQIQRIKATGLYIALAKINNQFYYASGYTRAGVIERLFNISLTA